MRIVLLGNPHNIYTRAGCRQPRIKCDFFLPENLPRCNITSINHGENYPLPLAERLLSDLIVGYGKKHQNFILSLHCILYIKHTNIQLYAQFPLLVPHNPYLHSFSPQRLLLVYSWSCWPREFLPSCSLFQPILGK